MKILFIEPPQIESGNISRFYGSFGTSKADFLWPPIELMSIAGYVRQSGMETLIYDAGGLKKTSNEVKEFIAKEKPDMIVFSTSTTTIYSDLKIASIAKEISKNIMTAAVGSHIMALPEETLKLSPYLDAAVYSDDEEVVVKNLAESKKDLSKVHGICYRDYNGKIIKNPPPKLLNNLDELGFPAHDLIDKNIYYDFLMKKRPIAL